MTYNGWTNYETWLVNIHFGSFTEVFNDMLDEGQFDDMTDKEILECCSDYIEQCVDDVVSDSVITTTDDFITDIITSFIDEVNYKEIASHYVADIVADVAIRNKDKVTV